MSIFDEINAGYKTGYFGIPGTNRTTKVHVVFAFNYAKEKMLPACGSLVGKDMEFQWCANGVVEEYIECKHCRRMFCDE